MPITSVRALYHNNATHNDTHNDRYIICANTSLDKVQVDRSRFCYSGNWENLVLTEDGYDIKEADGNALVKYWGNDPIRRNEYRKEWKFQLNSSYYCVRSFLDA